MTGVSATAVTEGPRDAVFAWWTDYHPDDHKGRLFRSYGDVERRVVWTEPGKGVEYRDEGKVLRLPFEARTVAEITPPERIKGRTESMRGTLHTDYWFEALPGGGTRITARAEYEPPKVVQKFAPLTDTMIHAALAYDLRAHVKEFDDWWKREGGGA